MAMIVSTPQLVKQQADALFHAFHYSISVPVRTLRQVSTTQLIKRRDTMVWRLLGVEHDIVTQNLEQYWHILDEMMEISVKSAIQIIEDAYCTRFRELYPHEQRQEYPGVQQQVYRMLSCERHKPYEDFTSGTLVEHALDVLQEQAYALL